MRPLVTLRQCGTANDFIDMNPQVLPISKDKGQEKGP